MRWKFARPFASADDWAWQITANDKKAMGPNPRTFFHLCIRIISYRTILRTGLPI
jgi:hypothetical protein